MTVRLKVFGNVQGVFFRQGAKDEADRLGLVGWVRNDPDGSVEALAAGPKENLEKFIAWCKKGSPGAKVERVEVAWEESNVQFSGFEII